MRNTYADREQQRLSEEDYERKTGRCANCGGYGTIIVGTVARPSSLAEVTCPRCKGTGDAAAREGVA
jgi:DnaJ-class molecular chaperone